MPSTSPTTFFGWVVFLLEQYGPLFLRGAGMTMLIAISGTILGFLIGLLVGIARTIKLGPRAPIWKRALVRLLNAVLGIYIEVFRGTPMIVQAMVIYYGLFSVGVQLPLTQAAILIVSINTGAYMAEIVRGGIISIDRGQTEAARSIGMTHWQTMVTVVLPQAVRNIMPSIGNEFVVNIKAVSYTHLDVYKRQVHKRPSLRVGLKLLNCKAVYIKPPCAPFVNIARVNFSMILRLKV